jgi:hypothetical protein
MRGQLQAAADITPEKLSAILLNGGLGDFKSLWTIWEKENLYLKYSWFFSYSNQVTILITLSQLIAFPRNYKKFSSVR